LRICHHPSHVSRVDAQMHAMETTISTIASAARDPVWALLGSTSSSK